MPELEVKICAMQTRNHPRHKFILGRTLYQCPGKGEYAPPTPPKGQTDMPFFTSDAKRFTFDFIGKNFTISQTDHPTTREDLVAVRFQGDEQSVILMMTASQYASLKAHMAQSDPLSPPSAPKPPKAPQAGPPRVDIYEAVSDLVAKARPFRSFLPEDLRKRFDQVDSWSQHTDNVS